MVKIKICGITNLEDALTAIALGVDALGFVFYAKSHRLINPHQAAAIISSLPPFIAKVGVFVDESLERVKQVLDLCSLDNAQLHGSESPEFCHALGHKAIKSIRVKDGSILEQLSLYNVGAFLLDTYSPNLVGGTGQTFNWDIAAEAAKTKRIILSGGLTEQNVARAIATVHPYAVDVSSGVEAIPGKKDHARMKAFIQAVREAT